MSAWEWFRASPVWLQVPALAVAGVLAVLLGFVLADSLFPASEGRPVAAVKSPNATTSTTTTSTSIAPTTTTLRATTSTRAVVVRLTNPLDIRSACQAVAVALMGQGVTDEEATKAVTLYQNLERAAQQPGATVRAPSLDAFCSSWIREQFPDDVRAYNYLKYAKVIEDLIRGGSPRSGSIPREGICHRETATGRDEYQAPTVTGSCPFGWELIR